MKRLFVIILAALVLYGCQESIDTSARYVFQYASSMSSLQNNEAYSE